jgi:hypothetical protein
VRLSNKNLGFLKCNRFIINKSVEIIMMTLL